jgi:hypothetical protein
LKYDKYLYKFCDLYLYLPPLMNSVLFDGKLEPKYATVYAGLNSPVFPLFKTPFQKLLTFGNGLSENVKIQLWNNHQTISQFLEITGRTRYITIIYVRFGVFTFSQQWLWRMPSSGILHCVTLVRTDVSEERIASIIRVARISELEITLAVTRNQSMLLLSTSTTYIYIYKVSH